MAVHKDHVIALHFAKGESLDAFQGGCGKILGGRVEGSFAIGATLVTANPHPGEWKPLSAKREAFLCESAGPTAVMFTVFLEPLKTRKIRFGFFCGWIHRTSNQRADSPFLRLQPGALRLLLDDLVISIFFEFQSQLLSA